jgi:hypothetical protein
LHVVASAAIVIVVAGVTAAVVVIIVAGVTAAGRSVVIAHDFLFLPFLQDSESVALAVVYS